jgi:hypothetical protein
VNWIFLNAAVPDATSNFCLRGEFLKIGSSLVGSADSGPRATQGLGFIIRRHSVEDADIAGIGHKRRRCSCPAPWDRHFSIQHLFGIVAASRQLRLTIRDTPITATEAVA